MNHSTPHQPPLNMLSLMSETSGGACQPPRNIVVASAETVNMLMYSARKNIAKRIEPYSVWNPPVELALALGEVEGQPVGLADHRHDVDGEREQAGRDVPERRLPATICEVDIEPL